MDCQPTDCHFQKLYGPKIGIANLVQMQIFDGFVRLFILT